MNALAILPITFSANGETIVFHARKSNNVREFWSIAPGFFTLTENRYAPIR